MMFFICFFYFAFSGEIQIKDITYTNHNVITFNDIAVFKDVSEGQKKQIGSLILAADLHVGVEREFSRDSLVGILKRYQSRNEKTTFIIPEHAVVKRSEDQFSKQNVEKKIASELEKTNLGIEVKVESIHFPKLPENIIDWELVLPHQITSAFVTIPVTYTVRNQGVDIDKKDSIQVKIKMFQTVPVVTENIFQGQRMNEEILQLQKIEVNRNQLFITNAKDILGKKLKRSLRQGEAIRITDLEKEYSVKAGEAVKMRVQENEISVVLEGIARQSGSVGDVIRINNPMNNRLVFGTIVGASEVEIK